MQKSLPLFCILAITDGILNNMTLESNKKTSGPNSRTQLLKNLGFFDNIYNHILYLRQRWVLGASQWFTGMNGSLQNLKAVFGYDDFEWQFIWSSMNKRGAWDVPKILDSKGSVIKENYAPEMMIKYMAHDLRCHIVVIDLQLGSIQFCSANYLQENNVIF